MKFDPGRCLEPTLKYDDWGGIAFPRGQVNVTLKPRDPSPPAFSEAKMDF